MTMWWWDKAGGAQPSPPDAAPCADEWLLSRIILGADLAFAFCAP